MKQFAVIVAGGSGTRMGGGLPKQFRPLCGYPVLWWSIKRFHEENPDTEIIIVLPSDFIKEWEDFCLNLPFDKRISHSVVAGGCSRTDSVKNGLRQVESLVSSTNENKKDSLVAIHDGARPLLTKEMISKGWDVAEKNGAAIPVVPVTDSLREKNGQESKAVDRGKYVAVQTPQVFNVSIITESYKRSEGQAFTDDATAVENAGYKVSLFDGSPLNIKITNPKDLEIAAVLMGKDA